MALLHADSTVHVSLRHAGNRTVIADSVPLMAGGTALFTSVWPGVRYVLHVVLFGGESHDSEIVLHEMLADCVVVRLSVSVTPMAELERRHALTRVRATLHRACALTRRPPPPLLPLCRARTLPAPKDAPTPPLPPPATMAATLAAGRPLRLSFAPASALSPAPACCVAPAPSAPVLRPLRAFPLRVPAPQGAAMTGQWRLRVTLSQPLHAGALVNVMLTSVLHAPANASLPAGEAGGGADWLRAAEFVRESQACTGEALMVRGRSGGCCRLAHRRGC